MEGYILDTDTWIEYFRKRGNIAKQIAEIPTSKIFASEVSIAELTFRALHSKAVERHLQEPEEIKATFTVLPLNNWMYDYAEIRQYLTSKGIVIGDFDILIAVTALHYGLTIVTHNIKHFSKIPGIKCVDWLSPCD